MMRQNPKGGGSIGAIFTVIIYLLITIVVPALSFAVGDLLVGGTIGANGVFCSVNIFWGCSKNQSSGSSYQAQAGASCSSAANSCGMTNLGSVVNTGGGQGECNATPPPNSSCPAPVITASGFYANPPTIGPNGQTTLYWSASNASACRIDGDNGFSNVGGDSGSVMTGALSQTTTYTLTCQNGGDGPETSASLRVIIDPHYHEI